MHSLPEKYHINIKSLNENMLMSPIEINIGQLPNDTLNDKNKNYEAIYMKSYFIQQEQYSNENTINLREKYLSELPCEVRDEMNRFKQTRFTMKEFNSFNQQMKK